MCSSVSASSTKKSSMLCPDFIISYWTAQNYIKTSSYYYIWTHIATMPNSRICESNCCLLLLSCGIQWWCMLCQWQSHLKGSKGTSRTIHNIVAVLKLHTEIMKTSSLSGNSTSNSYLQQELLINDGNTSADSIIWLLFSDNAQDVSLNGLMRGTFNISSIDAATLLELRRTCSYSLVVCLSLYYNA